MTDPAKPMQQTGQPIDGSGQFAIDPTKNVLDMVEAAVKRIDDLREADKELFVAKMEGMNTSREARFNSIEREFTLIESRRQEQKTDTKVAVDAALSAAKDAVKEQAAASEKAILKSETSAGEQSKQNAATFTVGMANITTMLSDVKERVGKIESLKQGIDDTRSNSRLDLGALIGVGGFVTAIAVAVAAFMKA